MSRPLRSPFDVTLTKEQRTTIGIWLSYELLNAMAARSSNEQEVEYWHTLYEQARTRTSNLPWPDAADLTSYIPCEQVDSIHARIMRTVWTEPFCTVSGFGAASDKAPFVEEVHQWWVEEEGLHAVLDKASLIGLIEPRILIEVSESSQTRQTRKTINAKVKTDPMSGGMIFDAKGPQLEVGTDGKYVEAGDQDISAWTVVDSPETVRTGPAYRVVPYRDSLILPGHARDDDEIWGYAKRIWKRKPDLLAQADSGVYDKTQVEALTEVGDRQQTATPALDRSQMAIPPQYGETAEKELWEVLWLIDLNDLLERHHQEPIHDASVNGARWYLVTIHVYTHNILRLQHDDLERGRYVPIILFPRPDRATEGFSMVGHKLITVTEEHTAFRNMGADATSKAVNAPIKRLVGALWDPDEQPLGPKSVTDVRDMREWEPVEMPDVPQSVFVQQQACENAGRRLGGINDIAAGQQVEKGNPTLGEVQMATEQSFVRMDLIVRRFQKGIESLMQIRHAIRKRMLAETPEGIDAPDSLVVGLEGQGVPIDQYLPNGKITAQLLEGSYRFKPYGSVETADVNRLRADVGQFMQFLSLYQKMFPQMAGILQSPQFARGMLRYVGRLYRVPNMQALLGSPSQDLLGQGGVTSGAQVPGQPGMPQPLGLPSGPQGLMPPGQGGMPMVPNAPPPMPMPNPLAPGPAGLQ